MAFPAGRAASVLFALAACSCAGPSLHGQPGLQHEVISFYNARAMERGATCPNPEMQSITSSQIARDEGQTVVMDIRYYWVDWSQAVDINGGNVTTCRDWNDRTFTFARDSAGKLQVVAMTGAQKSG
ncbi:MAG: hypothetical protein AB7I59_08565 [Geminicoccaceae bacterium]